MRAMTENIELMMPIKATPYDHQKKAFAFACDKFGVFDNRLKSRGAALLMEMGTGKTKSILKLLETLLFIKPQMILTNLLKTFSVK